MLRFLCRSPVGPYYFGGHIAPPQGPSEALLAAKGAALTARREVVLAVGPAVVAAAYGLSWGGTTSETQHCQVLPLWHIS